MAEYKNPQEGHFIEGHFPNTGQAVLELHRLLSIFLSSKSMAALRTNYPGEGFDPIYKIQEVEEDEITRLLLTLAVTARVIDDRQERIFQRADSNCGQLELTNRDNGDQTVEILNLREACNKIIHATKVRFDVEEDAGQAYFNPYIYIYGKQNKKNWKATLNIIDFSKAYVSIVCHS
jgi:hypothetical protein